MELSGETCHCVGFVPCIASRIGDGMRLIFDQVGLKGDPFGDEHPSQVSFNSSLPYFSPNST